MDYIKWNMNKFKSKDTSHTLIDEFTMETLNAVKHYHATMSAYETTPLHHLNSLADTLGVKKVVVKDESKRFNLNAFKPLGGSYAMAAYFARVLNLDLNTLSFNDLMEEIQQLDTTTFATVTAGNHGKGVAWAAGALGQKANVVLPAGSSESRFQAIQELGADAHISDLNYDDAVAYTAERAEQNGWVLLQDTAWAGYEDLPMSIMKGYTTIIAEILEQLNGQDLHQFTHVILQAGVGSFAAAMAAAIYNQRMDNPPIFIVAEPSRADCLYQSAESEDGTAQRVFGDLDSMMAGLACGEPNPIAWNILKQIADAFFSCDDEISARGMRILAAPLQNDPSIIAGESGALPIGLLNEIMINDDLAEAREDLRFDKNASVLVINTEGDTNPENYKQIVNN